MYTNEDYEFIELRNAGTSSINLAGFAITNGVEFTFGAETLAPNEYIVVVKNRAVFESRYGSAIPVAGQYTGSLDNSGERVVLVGPLLEPIADFNYNNEWYEITDGTGFSLVRREGATGESGFRVPMAGFGTL